MVRAELQAARRGRAALHKITLCTAALLAVAPGRAFAHRPHRPSLAEALLVAAAQDATSSMPTPNPRWLPALDEASPWPRPDSGWSVPAPWLRNLEALPRVGVPFGRLDVRRRTLGFRFNGRLRLGATDVPMLGGRVSLQLARYSVDFTVPGVMVVPHRENNLTYVEVNIVLIDRRF